MPGGVLIIGFFTVVFLQAITAFRLSINASAGRSLASAPSLRALMEEDGGFDGFLAEIDLVEGRTEIGKQFLNSIGALMLIFDGFAWESWPTAGWGSRIQDHAAASDPNSWDRITPTWKTTSHKEQGRLNFSLSATGPSAVQKMDIGFTGKTTGELGDFLTSKFHISSASYDAAQVKLMFSWSLVPDTPWVPTSVPKSSVVTPRVLLAFSFTGMKSCQSSAPDMCENPGRSNEMLAWSCLDYMQEHEDTILISQWEIVTSMKKLVLAGISNKLTMRDVRARAISVGDPGSYLNTKEIMDMMIQHLATLKGPVAHIAVVAHPDHLPRAYKTVKTAFVVEAKNGNLPAKLGTAEVIPAILPYGLPWEMRHDSLSIFKDEMYELLDGHSYSWFTPEGLEAEDGTGYKGLGYFPDGDPQFWVWERRTFLLYELWARAKVYATGGMIPPERW